MEKIVVLDVKELQPPAPLEQAMATARDLTVGQCIHMIHRRRPCMLFSIISEQGFTHKIIRDEEGHCELYIWRKNDQQAHDLVHSL